MNENHDAENNGYGDEISEETRHEALDDYSRRKPAFLKILRSTGRTKEQLQPPPSDDNIQ
jgi:hypothetical protein